MQKILSDNEKIAWIRLLRSDNVGPITFRQLLSRFGSAQRALEALPDMARRGGISKPLRIGSKSAAEKELETIHSLGASLIAMCEPTYPHTLQAIPDAPPFLIVKGHVHLMQQTVISLVGARNASANGRLFAARLSRELGEKGYVICSGLARGIDTAAHEASLATGTIGVVAGGVDIVYPPQNADLYDAIGREGLLISEMGPGIQPQARHFPRRNRIISGLSKAVVVVEASLNSGSLITARMAGEHGRDVMAVPGSPLDPRSSGCNMLLREGAILIQTSDDIVEHMSSSLTTIQEKEEAQASLSDLALPSDQDVSTAQGKVLELLGPAPIEVDELLRQCHISHSLLSLILLQLDLAGRLERHPGNKVSLLMAWEEEVTP